MKSFDFAIPTTLYHGPDCVVKNAGILCGPKGKALLVTGRSGARVCGALDDVIKALETTGTAWELFDRVEANPSLETCAAGGDAARTFGAGCVIGVGGGSALDAAKVIAAFAVNTFENPGQIFDGIENTPLPVFAVPTTAGTGSEVNRLAVLTIDGGLKKRSVRCGFPEAAFADPKYLRHLPRDLTVSCALDAFCHGLESFMSKRSHPLSEMLALRAVHVLWPALDALNCGQPDETVYDALSLGASVAGMAVQATGTELPHPMGYNLTLGEGVPHGAATAAFLPFFIERCCEVSPGRISCVSEAADALPGEMGALVAGLHGVKVTLTEEKARQYARRISSARQFTDGLFEFSEDDIAGLYMSLFGH